MPIYEYECNLCSHKFEIKQGFDDEPVAECPRCQGQVQRILHPTPIIFKGSGFYITDSRKGSPAEKAGEGMPSQDKQKGK